MVNIDDIEEIRQIDTENVYGSVEELPKQLEHAFSEALKVDVPEHYKEIKNVVMAGMGGSGLGARVIESVFGNDTYVPIIRVNDYSLPRFVYKETLVIVSSYSGTTEEAISAAENALMQSAKLMIIGTGGPLIQLAEKENIPFYKIDPKYNPSNQPRMAVGYSVIGQLVLSTKAGLFELEEKDILVAIDAMSSVIKDSNIYVAKDNNTAKSLAGDLAGRLIAYVSSQHLVGAMHTVNNQLNENAKNFSFDFQIPELNHHLLEGIKHPHANPGNLFFLFADSDLYPERIRKRVSVTKDVVSKNDIPNFTYKLNAPTKLAQAFELIQFGAYVNFYLSMLYNQNPAPIPWVDFFKEQMNK